VATITSLEPEPRGGGVRLRLDGQPFATLGAGDVVTLRLAVGREVSSSLLERLEQRAEVHAARGVALRMLAARALPASEITRRLLRRGHPRRAAEQAVAALEAEGLIDDAEFARHYARTRARNRLGAGRLVSDIRRLGVEERLARGAVSDVFATEGVDEHAMLREAARRKAKSLAGLDRDRRVRRLRSFLLRRGFPLSEVRVVVRELAG
jgi:regulatory protein